VDIDFRSVDIGRCYQQCKNPREANYKAHSGALSDLNFGPSPIGR
jgi:hypothetical protein